MTVGGVWANRYMGLTRQSQTGVTSLSMNAGTGKIKVVSAARAGVPRATLSAAEQKRLASYDASAALGLQKQVWLYLRSSSFPFPIPAPTLATPACASCATFLTRRPAVCCRVRVCPRIFTRPVPLSDRPCGGPFYYSLQICVLLFPRGPPSRALRNAMMLRSLHVLLLARPLRP